MPCDSEGNDWNTGNAPFRILSNGVTYIRNINMNGESGYVKVNFDSGRQAVQLQYNALTYKLDNEDNSVFVQLARKDDGFYIYLQNAPKFCVFDTLHNRLSYLINLNNGDRQTHWFRGQMYKNFADNGQDWYPILDTSGSASDRRLKHNIKDSNTSALDIISEIRFRQFDWNEDTPYANKHIDIGVIAQEVKEIDENYVEKNERVVGDKVEEMYTMNELNLITTTMKAIQELNNIVKEQEKTIKELQDEIDKLKKGDK